MINVLLAKGHMFMIRLHGTLRTYICTIYTFIMIVVKGLRIKLSNLSEG